MNKKNILYLLIILIFICFPKNILAARCDNKEKIKLASLAQNISFTYDYTEENHQVSFYIIFTNLQPGLKIKDVSNNREYTYNGNEMTLYGYNPSSNYRFDVYADTTCKDRLYSHYVTTPGYNPYYDNILCEGVTASICQKWATINYDYDTFVNEVNKYKSNNTAKTDRNEEKVMGIYDYIFKFITNYYYIIFPIIIILGTTGIIMLRRKDDLF